MCVLYYTTLESERQICCKISQHIRVVGLWDIYSLLYTLKGKTQNQHKHTMRYTEHQLIIYMNTIIYVYTEDKHTYMTYIRNT